jgi:hypothetical protein
MVKGGVKFERLLIALEKKLEYESKLPFGISLGQFLFLGI